MAYMRIFATAACLTRRRNGRIAFRVIAQQIAQATKRLLTQQINKN